MSGPPARSLRLGGTAVLATSAGLAPVFLVGSLGVLLQRDLGFGAVELGLGVSVAFAVSTLMAVPAGQLAARMGSTFALRSASIAVAGVGIGIALATSSWRMLVVCLGVAGMANALAQAGANHLLVAGMPPRQRSIAFGMKEAAIPLASLIAGLALPVVGLPLGWRSGFLVVVPLAVMLFVLADVKGPRPRSAASTSPGRGKASSAAVPLALAAMFGSAAITATVPFLVGYLVSLGYPPSRAGLALGSGSAIAIVSRLTAGWLGYRGLVHPFAMVIILLLIGSMGFALMGVEAHPWVQLAATFLVFAAGWGWTGSLFAGVSQTFDNSSAFALPLAQAGFSFGGLVGPVTFGVVVEQSSYPVAWRGLAGASVCAAVLVMAGRAAARARDERGS